MRLTEQHVISRSHPLWSDCDRLCALSKNLYNASLYDVRQHYFNTKKYKSWQTQRPEFVKSNNPDYRALPAKISGEVIRQVGRNFTSFFATRAVAKTGRTVRIPHYLPKEGRNILSVPKDAISRKPLRKGEMFEHVISPKSLGLHILSRVEHVDAVRIIPRQNRYVIEVISTEEDVDEKTDNGKYAAIDLGVTNVMTVVSNTFSPLIFGGKVKSINQFYNKRLARTKQQLPKEVKTSRKIKAFTNKRNDIIKSELHKMSTFVVNQLVSSDVHTLVIGHNKEWKQDTRMGKRNNQSFVSIPHSTLIHMLTYKCQRQGIRVIETEESYTSKTSFLDREVVGKHDAYMGKRTKRGLFCSQNGDKINADVNGAYNIMRKVVPDQAVYREGIEGIAVCPRRVKSRNSTPCRSLS